MQISDNLRQHYPLFLTLLFGLCFVTIPIVGWELKQIPGDLGDGRFNMYLLELGHQYLFHGLDWYWKSPFMWPEKQIITYSDNLLGTVPLYSFFRMLSLDRETAYQMWFVTLSSLNFICAYFALFKMLKCSKSAALGAFIYAFSIALMGQVFHAQTFPRFVIPLALWAVYEFHNSKKVAYLGISFVFVVYQIYCGIYLGLMLAIPYGIYLIIMACLYRTDYLQVFKVPKNVIQILGWALFSFISLWWLMAPYMNRANHGGLHNYDTVFEALPSIQSYFFAAESSVIWSSWLRGFINSLSIWWNNQHFMGFFGTVGLLLLFIILGRCLMSKGKAAIWQNGIAELSIVGVILFVLYLKIGDYSAYKVIFHLPGYGSMRAVGRIVNLILFFAGLGLAISFSMIKIRNKKAIDFVFLGVLTLLVLDNSVNQSFPKMEKAQIQERVQTIVDKMDGFPKGGIMSYEPFNTEENGIYINIDGMLAAQTKGMKSVNGYSATSAEGFSNYWRKPSKENREIWLVSKPNVDTTKIYVVK